jgi:hypothetical protein
LLQARDTSTLGKLSDKSETGRQLQNGVKVKVIYGLGKISEWNVPKGECVV